MQVFGGELPSSSQNGSICCGKLKLAFRKLDSLQDKLKFVISMSEPERTQKIWNHMWRSRDPVITWNYMNCVHEIGIIGASSGLPPSSLSYRKAHPNNVIRRIQTNRLQDELSSQRPINYHDEALCTFYEIVFHLSARI